MRPTNTQRGAWLARRVGFFGSVGGIAGAGFEAYARILHPVRAHSFDRTTVDRWGNHPLVQADWPWAGVAARTGRTMHPLVQWTRLIGEANELVFDDGWSVSQTHEGWFDPALCAAITPHLRAATTTPDGTVVGVWVGWGGLSGSSGLMSFLISDDGRDPAVLEAERRATEARHRAEAEASVSTTTREASMGGPHDTVLELPHRQYLLLGGSLAELADPDWGFTAGIGWHGRRDPSPQLIWPDDHAWVVGSEIDWDSTIVAGSRALIDAILADPAVEAFEVAETDTLTIDSDTVNR